MSTTHTQFNRLFDSTTDTHPYVSRRVFTVPNVISMIRIAGSVVLVGLAVANQPNWFIGLFVFLALTDWLDGKLAILLNQRTELGARLDSASDAILFSALLVGGLILRSDALMQQIGWIAASLITYTVSMGVGLWKFRRTPSYHTRAAKSCWLFVTIGALCLLGDVAAWPFQVAMVAVTLTNLEATVISLVLDEWQADVTSLYHAILGKNTPFETR